jgi:hypothetical protein
MTGRRPGGASALYFFALDGPSDPFPGALGTGGGDAGAFASADSTRMLGGTGAGGSGGSSPFVATGIVGKGGGPTVALASAPGGAGLRQLRNAPTTIRSKTIAATIAATLAADFIVRPPR